MDEWIVAYTNVTVLCHWHCVCQKRSRVQFRFSFAIFVQFSRMHAVERKHENETDEEEERTKAVKCNTELNNKLTAVV